MQRVKLRMQQLQYAREMSLIVDPRHHPHVLELTEERPDYSGQAPFQCAVCGQRNKGQCYACWKCRNDVHIGCVSRGETEVLTQAESRERKAGGHVGQQPRPPARPVHCPLGVGR